MSLEQDSQKELETKECIDLTTTMTQGKRLRSKESPHARKKSKTANTLEK